MNQKQKFEWLPTECAPSKFPMQILKADFSCENGEEIYIPDGRMIFNGWGNIGSIHIMEEKLKPIPNQLDITWFSFTEDIFFSGSFSIPQSIIAEEFTKGYYNPESKTNGTYSKIAVGMAPGGYISIWLIGEQVTKLVTTYYAEKIKISWVSFMPNPDYPREKYIQLKLDQIFDEDDFTQLKNNGVPTNLWDKKYNRKNRLNFKTVSSQIIQFVHCTYFNAEKEFWDFDSGNSEKAHFNPTPEIIKIKWESSREQFFGEIKFNENEIYEALDKISVSNAKEVELQIHINSVNQSISVFLTNESVVLELVKSQIKIYTV